MSVTTTNISTTRVGNGVLVAFDFNMVTYDEAWIFVTLDGVDETSFSTTLNADQTVSPGGTVIFNTAPANGVVIIMAREVPIVQEQILPAFSAFPAVVVEHGLDELVMMMQQLNAAPEGSNVIDSPLLINNEFSTSNPNPLSIRFFEGLGSTPWFLETVPFQPGRAAGLKTTTLFSAIEAEYDFHLAIIEDRGLYLAPSHPLISDTSALATVQFVLDNAGGQGSNPTFDSITLAHDTDVPTNGNVVIQYTTALGPTVTHTFDDLTGAKAWSWETIGLADELFEFVYLNEFAVLPTPLTSYDGGPINVAATVEYVLSVIGGGGTGPFIADGGSVTEPAFTFVGDTNTGIWQDVEGSIHFTINGVDILVMSAFGIAMTSALDLGNNVIQNVVNPTTDNHVGDRGFNDNRYVSSTANQSVSGEKTFTDTNTNVQNLVSVGNVAAGAIGGGNGNYVGIGAFGILIDSGVAIGGGGGVDWGGIGGTLSNQTDLNNALNAKANTTTNFSAGTGLTGGGTLAANRSFAVDTTVVRTTGAQTIAGEKTFSNNTTMNGTLIVLDNIASVTLVPQGPLFAGALGIIQTTDPSARYLKDHITEVTDSLGRICSLIPCTFDMIDDETHRMRYGFIADEAGLVYPSLATRDDDGILATFNQNELIADLVASVKILTERIEALGG